MDKTAQAVDNSKQAAREWLLILLQTLFSCNQHIPLKGVSMSNQGSINRQNRFRARFTSALWLVFFWLLLWQPRLAYAATYTVTTTADSGPGSLRQAMLDANANPGADLITFSINEGLPTIKPLSPLPAITDEVMINALGGQPCDTLPPQPRVVLDGALAGANADGLQVRANLSQVIGLYITRFTQNGITISAANTLVACTIIGLDPTGAAAGNGQHGIHIENGAQANLIGENGMLAGYPRTLLGNVIAGNGGDGIRIEGQATMNNRVADNFIGLTASGEGARPNAGAGIRVIDAADTHIAKFDLLTGTGNRIAYNGGAGIVVAGAATATVIESNQIYSNTGVGIDLGDDGVTLNDPGDGDSGPNNRQNFPVITEAYVVGDETTVVRGTIHSLPNARFPIQLFVSRSCDASGFGEGAEFLGQTEVELTDANGQGQFVFVLERVLPADLQVTATALYVDPDEVNPLQSSEFSACKAVNAQPPAITDFPIVRRDSATTAEETPITIDVLANDTAPNNKQLVLAGVGYPNAGTAQIVENKILYTPALDFNGDVTFFYRVNDGDDNHTMTTHVKVTVTPVNDAPFSMLTSWYSIAENLPGNSVVGTLYARDVDDDDFFSFSLTGAYSDNTNFQIVGDQLLSRTTFDFERKASYTIRVRVSDRSGGNFETDLTVNIDNTNDAPTAINLSNNRIDENQPAGLTVGVLTSVDPDVGDTHSYWLTPGAGSDDNSRFQIEGATLKTLALLDYEAKPTYSIRIYGMDRVGVGREQIFLIHLNNLPAPPDVVDRKVTFCSGTTITLIDANHNDAAKRVLLKIEGITITPTSETSCRVDGKLTLTTNGNTVSNLPFSGNVNANNWFSSSTIPDFTLTIAGLTLQAHGVQLDYYAGRVGLRITKPTLKMPDDWGGLSAPLDLPPVINSGGINFGAAATIKLPTITTKSGFGLELAGSLVSVAGGYQIKADGSLTIPNIGKKKTAGSQGQTCTINAGVTIFAGAQGQTMMVIAAGNEQAPVNSAQDPNNPQAILVADALRLDKIRAGFACDPGIPIANSGFFLIGLHGEITLTPNNETVKVTVNIEAGKKLPVIGRLITLDGEMDLKVRPDFKLDLGVMLKLLTFKMSDAKATMTKDRFSTTIEVHSVFTHGKASINAWSTDGKFHFTGSGTLKLGLVKGSIAQTCKSVPCSCQTCWWGIFPYPCNCKRCSVCISVPPINQEFAGVGVDAGEFTNGRYGFKGYVSVVGRTVGFFIDEQGKLNLGNVDQYHLIAGPTVAAAHQAWAKSLQANMSVNAAAFAPYTFLDASAGGGVIISTPLLKPTLDLNQVQAAQATDVISKVNLIPHADVAFTLKARGPLGFTLITPQGLEVTPANYNQSATLGYTILYTHAISFERENGQEENRTDTTLPTLYFTPLALGATANAVDVQIDGATAFGNVTPTNAEMIEPVALSPGTHTVTLVKRGTNDVVLSTSLTLITATDYSLLSVPLPQSNNIELVTLVDDNRAPASLGMAKVRFFNGTANGLTMTANGAPLFTDVAFKTASSYALVAAGTFTVELRHSGDNGLVSRPLAVNLVEGGVYTFFSADYTADGYAVGLFQRQDASYVASYLTEYSVNQAPTGGAWQVKLTGDTDNTLYLLSVAGPSSPPVLASVTMDARNPAATQVNWRLTSDLQPTQVTLYINPGAISESITVTDANGLVSTQEIPLFTGYPVAEYVISDLAQLGGQPVSKQIDLSKLPSGSYHLWVRADDGVNPPVSTYAAATTVQASAVQDEYGFNSVRVAKLGYNPLRQLADATPIQVDHTNDFPTGWNAMISTTLNSADQSLYVEWLAHPHPDVDNYRLTIGTNPLNPTQVITVGNAVVEYDTNGLATDQAIGFSTLANLTPDVTYYLAIEAVATKSGRQVRSQEVSFRAGAGSYTLAAPQPSYSVAQGGQAAIPLTFTAVQPLFYPKVGLGLDLGAAPLGLTANFLGDVEGNSVLSAAQPSATLQVAVDTAVPAGRYPIKVNSYNGAIQQTLSIEIVVGDAPVRLLYLPLVAR